jgi:hypothetical protein
MESGEAVRSTATINGSHLFFGTADGTIHCLRWRAETEELMLPADSYRADGEWLLAGTAAAHAGQWLEAAEDFERGAQPYVAAQLNERAQAWEVAAPVTSETWPKCSCSCGSRSWPLNYLPSSAITAARRLFITKAVT